MLKEVFPFSAELYKGGIVCGRSALSAYVRARMGDYFYEKSRERYLSLQKRYRKLVPIAQGELWVREETGHNDGERVEEYLQCVGLEKGQPYCAAFVSWGAPVMVL